MKHHLLHRLLHRPVSQHWATAASLGWAHPMNNLDLSCAQSRPSQTWTGQSQTDIGQLLLQQSPRKYMFDWDY